MKISAISQNSSEDSNPRRNFFIRYSNSFMSMPHNEEEPVTKALSANPANATKKPAKMGIENLQEFTIFPKEVVDGKTIITA